MNAHIIIDADISHLEKLLLKNGLMIPVDYELIKDEPQENISNFCVQHGIYQIITTQLVDFIRNEIGGQAAIEIGSGNGCLGRALGIPLTDNRMQEWPHIRHYYLLSQQQPINYPRDVQKLDAADAIKKFKPDVVVASWVTQKWKFGMGKNVGANEHGIDETKFKGLIKKYILVGNEDSHGDKDILLFKTFPVITYKFDWLVSRSLSKQKNLIYIFNCQ